MVSASFTEHTFYSCGIINVTEVLCKNKHAEQKLKITCDNKRVIIHRIYR